MPNPSTIRRQAKRFKETGSVKNKKVKCRRHVLTESNKITEITYTYCEYTHVRTIRIPVGMSQITITILTALTYNNNHNQ